MRPRSTLTAPGSPARWRSSARRGRPRIITSPGRWWILTSQRTISSPASGSRYDGERPGRLARPDRSAGDGRVPGDLWHGRDLVLPVLVDGQAPEKGPDAAARRGRVPGREAGRRHALVAAVHHRARFRPRRRHVRADDKSARSVVTGDDGYQHKILSVRTKLTQCRGVARVGRQRSGCHVRGYPDLTDDGHLLRRSLANQHEPNLTGRSVSAASRPRDHLS